MKTFIREEAIRQGVDPDLILRLARVESGYNPQAVSNKNAYGIMQLTPIAAKEMGVDRRDAYDNVRGGIGYFKKQLDAFGGDTEKALAAYNAGASKVKKYGGIPPYPETQQYVAKIMGNRDGSDIFTNKGNSQDGSDIFSSTPSGSGADIFTAQKKEKITESQKPPISPPAKLLGSSPLGFAGRTLMGAANLAVLEPFQLGANIGDKIGNLPFVKQPLVALMEALNVPVAKGEVISPKEKINTFLADIEAYKKEGGHEGFDWGGLLGSVGMGIKGLAKTPGATQLGTKLQNYITATPPTIKGRMAQGAIIGGALGRSPITNAEEGYFEQKIPQLGIGIALGGVVPGAIGGVSSALDFVKKVRNLKTPEGVDNITSKILNQAAGKDKEKIIELLRNPKDYLKGSKSTVGEYTAEVNNPLFAGLQKVVAPHSPNAYYDVAHTGKEAINNALNAIAKTPMELEMALAHRSNSTKPLYKAAKKAETPIDVKPLSEHIKEVLNQNKYTDDVTTPLRSIQKDLSNIMANEGKPKDLISLSDNIQKKIADTKENGTPLYNVKVLTNIKNHLDSIIASKVPEQKQADSLFGALSDPINRMRVGQYLKDKLTAPLAEDGSDALFRSNAFAQAMRDAPKTAERATGYYQELKDVFKKAPKEFDILGRIQKDLARKAKYEELASYGHVGAKDLVDNIFPHVPSIGMFSALYSVLRAGVRNVEGSARDKALANLGQVLDSNPGKVAELMSRLPPEEKQKLLLKLLDARAMKVTPAKAAAQYIQEQQ